MFGRLGPVELILILCIALVIFGPSKLPQIGRSLGQAIQEFKKGTADVKNDINAAVSDEKPAAKTSEESDKKNA